MIEAAILHGHHLVDFDDAGFGVDGHFRHLHATDAAVGEVGLVLGGGLIVVAVRT